MSKETAITTHQNHFVSSLSQLANEDLAAKLAALQAITSYQGAESEKASNYINKVMLVVGCVVHNVQIKREDIDPETGEVIDTYVDAKRTAFKLHDGKLIGFVSRSAEDFATSMLFPLFGIGDWFDPTTGKQIEVPIMIRQIDKGERRTYAFQVVTSEK